jgi:hypothetical protein
MDIQNKEVDLTAYRRSALEQARIGDLLKLVPDSMRNALDVGARDGYISRALTERCQSVTALDLEQPRIAHKQIRCVQGDVAKLAFKDREFDLVLCAEVLEHLPDEVLRAAVSELQRVTNRYLIIGVPFEQDTRLGRTTCYTCGETNPPWSHVGVFDAARLRQLFPGMRVAATSLVGSQKQRTNSLSTWLMAKAGNPYGTYAQEEPCVHCGAKLKSPPVRSFIQKAETKIAVKLNQLQAAVQAPRPVWIHVLLQQEIAVDPIGIGRTLDATEAA